MIFLFITNALFLFSGICLNSCVILSFWRSEQLRRKTCHFTVMVLSCFDLLAILTNHPLMAVIAMLWLTGNLNEWPSWVDASINQTNLFLGFSLLALLVMNFDRYLAASFPIFHRAKVTKARILILLALLIIVEVTLDVISLNGLVLSYQNGLLVFLGFIVPPMLFMNAKLLAIVRKRRKSRQVQPSKKQTLSLKNISSCMLAVACFLVLSIPALVYIGLKTTSESTTFRLDRADVFGIWSKTFASINGTLNCLIFYWRNKVMRTEGMKIIRKLRKKPSPILVKPREESLATMDA